MKKNEKRIFILIVLFIIIYLIISVIQIIPKGKKYKNTVFLGSCTKVSINKDSINVYNEDKALIKQNVKAYFKNNFINANILSTVVSSSGVKNSYYVQNLKNSNLYFDQMLIAHTPDISIEVKDGESYDSIDLTDFNSFAELNNVIIGEDTELNFQEINKIDIDNDNTFEYIYSVNLISGNIYDVVDDSEETIGEYDTIVFMKKDGNYFIIDRNTGDNDGVNNICLRFMKLIDFNKDGNYEFVVEKSMSEYGPYYYELYNFDGSKFTKIGGE